MQNVLIKKWEATIENEKSRRKNVVKLVIN